MKKKIRYQKTEDGNKKSVLKFKDYYDDDMDDSDIEFNTKRKKDVGKRLHRKDTMKEHFLDNDN
jgi:hypothetical protein